MRALATAGLVLGCLGAAGCKEELGPEPMPTTRVVGRVHLRSQPITGGWLQFSPVDGTVGLIRTARIRPDGTFEADRVALGRNTIAVMEPPAGELNPLPLRDRIFFQRPGAIRRDIVVRPVTTIDIDLQDEWLRLVRLQQAARAG